MTSKDGKRGYETVDVQGLDRTSTEVERLELVGSPRPAASAQREAVFMCGVLVLLLAIFVAVLAVPAVDADVVVAPVDDVRCRSCCCCC